MNRVAIAFLTKDRVELTRQTAPALLLENNIPYRVFWFDGSQTYEGKTASDSYPYPRMNFFPDVRGGADAAIVRALTYMLSFEEFTHVGLCENDVLLGPDWFAQTMALFTIGQQEGLNVGAASPRCYEDRILVQREGYACVHNLGAGIVIFTREAARLILDSYRTTFSYDNRLIFGQLAGVDIGTYWAFRGDNRWLTADWGFDAILASAGLCSLCLTPSPVEMIGQVPSLAEQGLLLAKGRRELAPGSDRVFEIFRDNLARVYQCKATMTAWPPIHHDPSGAYTFFPHQVRLLGGTFSDDWNLKWCQGFGPFSYRASAGSNMTVPASGVCEILMSGGQAGARIEVVDEHSGYTCSPQLAPEGPQTQVLSIIVPGGPIRRNITLTTVDAGAVFYGIRTGTPQMMLHQGGFDHSVLPPVAFASGG